MAHPQRFEELERALLDERPSLIASFLASTAQVHSRIPGDVPFIAVLEEAFDRVLLNDAPQTLRKSFAARREARLLQRHYSRVGARADRLVVISDEEESWFSRFAPASKIEVIPHGIDTRHFLPQHIAPDIDVLIVGDLSQARNYRAARNLFDQMTILSAGRSLTWAFVGRDPHHSILDLQSSAVQVTGFVPDVRPWYARARVVAAPTVSGSGVKTTVLQAWAMGKPVVSTPFSATGLGDDATTAMIIARSESDMCREILNLLEAPQRAAAIGEAARAAVVRRHEISTLANRFASLCRGVATSSA